jgi:hypothetical protein
VLTLHERYQLNQHTSAILRRPTESRPSFTTMTRSRVIADIDRLVAVHKGGGGS